MCRYCKRAYLYRDMERDCLDYMFQTVSLSCIKDWCINYNLDMVSGRYVTEKHMMNNTGMNSLSNRGYGTETIYT